MLIKEYLLWSNHIPSKVEKCRCWILVRADALLSIAVPRKSWKNQVFSAFSIKIFPILNVWNLLPNRTIFFPLPKIKKKISEEEVLSLNGWVFSTGKSSGRLSNEMSWAVSHNLF